MRPLSALQVLLAILTCSQAGVIYPRQSSGVDSSASKPLCTKKITSGASLLNSEASLIATDQKNPDYSPVPHKLDSSRTIAEKWYQLSTDDVVSGEWGLSQQMTNGNSPLGSLQAPKYPAYVTSEGSNADPDNCPWGNRTAADTDSYHDAPDTGVIRKYSFNIERGVLAPDGVPRSVILVNGEFPGPTIEANWGDWFEIEVVNNIQGPAEGTSLHWHGILQKDTPWEDGVPGISQCPIAPGETFTYRFKADLYGTSWWHAHYSAQYTAGIFGAMVIHGPFDNAHYDVDLGPVLISDYFHDDYFNLVETVMSAGEKPALVFSDNNLINGKGIYNCSFAADPSACNPNAGLSKFHFQKGKLHRLRLVNAGAEGLQKFSIDGHKLTVIAYDFVPIIPYETEIVTLSVGQRADVIVTADGDDNGIYWMRSSMAAKCSLTNQPNALALVYYDEADIDAKANSTAWTDNTDPCANDDLSTSVPFYAMTPTEPDMDIEIDITFGQNATGHYLWYANNSTFRADFNNPVLPMIMNGGGKSPEDYPKEWNVYDVGGSKSVRITINNLTPVAHPMHMHGHNMYVLSATHPPYPSTNTSSSNSTATAPSASSTTTTSITQHRTRDADPEITDTSNPTRRDTQILSPFGQIVLQFDGDNPGVWPLHCHVAWHVSAGLYVTLVEDPDTMRTMASSTNNWQESANGLCNAWQAYTDSLARVHDEVDIIDSGLKMSKKLMFAKEK